VVEVVERLRVAFGTGVVLGLWSGEMEVRPLTAHLMLWTNGRCASNCRFCPQARDASGDLSRVSRVVWPEHAANIVFNRLKNGGFMRVCVQAVNYPNFFDDMLETVEELSAGLDIPISVCSQPLEAGEMKALRDAGVERLCVPIDCASEQIFSEVKGQGYRWEEHIKAIRLSHAVFGKATTHLIVGLGETEEDAVRTVQRMHDEGITVGLFAFFPVSGTPLEKNKQPEVGRYRRVQLARYLISNNMVRVEDMKFEDGRISEFAVSKDEMENVVCSGKPFETSGCPHCNRPFFNESPRGPVYNYPRPLIQEEIKRIRKELRI